MTIILILYCKGLTVLWDAKLHVIHSHTLNMTWDPLAKPVGRMSDCTTEWNPDERWQKIIQLALSNL